VDILCACILGVLLYCKALEGPWERGAALMGILAIAGVAGVLRSQGKVGGLVMFGVHGLQKPAAVMFAAFAKHGSSIFAALAFMLTGCAGMDLPSPETARIAANKSAQAMNRLGPVLAAACATEPPPWCADAIEAFNDVGASHKLLQDWIDAYGVIAQ
jgi:hypothetical protein